MTDLLLLHGALGAAAQMQPLVAHFERTHRVHVLEFEGHGASAMRNRPYRIEHFAENVLTYLEAASLQSVAVFGFSMGGYVALHLAGSEPSRIERIATLGTKFDWTPESAARETRMLDAEVMLEKVPGFAAMLQQRHSAPGWKNVLLRTAEMMTALGAEPAVDTARLGRVNVPVRICVGDRDRMVSLEESIGAFRALPNAELQVLPATPHPLEQVPAERVVAALADFFSDDRAQRT